MAIWDFFNYAELNGRNQIRAWLDGLPEADRAKIDYRLLQMAGEPPPWREKWVSRYRGTDELYEFRITGKKVQYRPLGTYFGELKYLILNGAIEKNWKIPKSDVQTAVRRLSNIRKDSAHVVPHQFDDEEDLEENE